MKFTLNRNDVLVDGKLSMFLTRLIHLIELSNLSVDILNKKFLLCNMIWYISVLTSMRIIRGKMW